MFFLNQYDLNKPGNMNELINFSEGEAVHLSNQKVEPLWIDYYICALCGTKLPPSFTEEMQEHTDYHLAEMLQ